MKPSEKLLAKIRATGFEIPEGSTIRRTYAGHWQKAQGANIWHVVDPDGNYLCIGSQFTVTELLKLKEITVEATKYGDYNVDPK